MNYKKVKVYETQKLSMSHVNDDRRYIIVSESLSAHCCFKYSVVDTKKGKSDSGNYWKNSICETFEMTDAILICQALNHLNQKQTA